MKVNFNSYLENSRKLTDYDGINLTTDKNVRLGFGDKAAQAVLNDLKIKGFDTVLTKDLPRYTTKMDLVEGDLFVYRNDKTIKIDIKRGRSVSLKSAKEFQGDYYIFVNNYDLADAYVVRSIVVKNFILKLYDSNPDNLIKLPSGELGYKFDLIKMRLKIPYDEWTKSL